MKPFLSRGAWHYLKCHSRRGFVLEREKDEKGLLKRFSENAGAVGLTLGLILSASSLYDVFVRKPEADRIVAISQFNQSVSSAAKIRQELLQASQNGDAALRLSVSMMATPRILNEIATAKALLAELREEDVGIPQLLILITESMTAGDNASAEGFVKRAVEKKNVPSFMVAEARRYKGKYLFVIGKPAEGRKMYLEAAGLLGNDPVMSAARAFNLADLIAMQYAFGYCGAMESDIDELVSLLRSQGIAAEVRAQLAGSVSMQLSQYSGQKCKIPPNAEVLVAMK